MIIPFPGTHPAVRMVTPRRAALSIGLKAEPVLLEEGELAPYLSSFPEHARISLTYAQEIALAQAIEAGDQPARERLIESNLRLVIAIAKAYQGHGMDLLDLIQEGNLGLMKALPPRYDWRKGYRFSTYAVFWIRDAISEALSAQGRLISIPEHIQKEVKLLAKARQKLTLQMGKPPTQEELALSLGKSLIWVQVREDLPEVKVWLGAQPKLDEVEEARLARNAAWVQPETGSEVLEEVYQDIERLSPRYRLILCQYFGILGQKKMSLKDLKDQHGVSIARIQQIVQRALGILREARAERDLCA